MRSYSEHMYTKLICKLSQHPFTDIGRLICDIF